MLKDMPGNAKEIDEARTALHGLRAELLLTDIERAMKGGRYEWSRTQLASSRRPGPTTSRRPSFAT